MGVLLLYRHPIYRGFIISSPDIFVKYKKEAVLSNCFFQFVKKVPTKRNPLPRGEGGPPERSSEKAGRERNAGGNLKVRTTYRPGIRLDFDEAHRKSQHFSYPRFPPAFLFSHQSVPKSRLATASPRGKRLGCSRTRRFFDSLSAPHKRCAFPVLSIVFHDKIML